MSQSSIKRPISLGLLGIYLTHAAFATAQDAAAPSPAATAAPTSPKKTERIEVTGSRIKRVDAEGAAPVTVLSRESIERSGATNVADLLKKSNVSPTGNDQNEGLSTRSGAASVDLLGIGANRTLVLLDGKRLPVESSLGAANVANIPVSVIERIEILSGGASAIYGTDAVGGVINIITKKDFHGIETSASVSVPQHGGGESLEINAIGGGQINDDTSAFLYGGYKQTREVLRKNRKGYKISDAEHTNTATLAPPGTFSYRPIDNFGTADQTPGDYMPSANCPTDRQVATVPDEPQNVYCSGPRSETSSWLTPRSNEKYLVARGDHEFSADTKLSGFFLYDTKSSFFDLGNYLVGTSDPFNSQGVFLSQARAEELGITGIQPGQVVELEANTIEMPHRESINKDSVIGTTAQLETKWNEWSIVSGASHFLTQNKRSFNNILNKQKEIELLHPRANLLDPAFIPIDPNRNSALLDGIHDNLMSKEVTTASTFEVTGSHEITTLPGGKMQGLVGIAVSSETYKQTPDKRDQVFYTDTADGLPPAADGSNVTGIAPLYEGTSSTAGQGNRTVTSLFTEIVAPVLQNLEFETALRYDVYSDFGNTLNYGAGVKYKALPNLLLRGNAASSFRAPVLNMMHATGGGGYISVVDDRYCQREKDRGNPCELGSESNQLFIDVPGNPDLKEEKGKSYTFGLVYEPMPGLSLMTDYFAVHLQGTQNTDVVQDVLDRFYRNEGIGKNKVFSDSDGVATNLATPYQNIGTLMVNAIDARLNYSQKLGSDTLAFDSDYFTYISYRKKDFLDDPTRQLVGYKGLPKWRLNNSASYVFNAAQTVTLNALTIAKQQTDPKDYRPGQRYANVDQYTEYDLSYALELPTNGNLLVGVNDVFDTYGGKDSSGNPRGDQYEGMSNGLTSLYGMMGRTYFAKMTQRF